jgi:hypothetical protein
MALGDVKFLGSTCCGILTIPISQRYEFWRAGIFAIVLVSGLFVYIPWGGSNGGMAMKIKNTFIIFL